MESIGDKTLVNYILTLQPTDALAYLDTLRRDILCNESIAACNVRSYLGNMSTNRLKELVHRVDTYSKEQKHLCKISMLVFKELLRDYIHKIDKRTIYAVCEEYDLNATLIHSYIHKGMFEPSYIDLLGKIYLDVDDIEFLIMNKEMCKKLYTFSDVSRKTGFSVPVLKKLYYDKKLRDEWVGLNGVVYFNDATVQMLLQDKEKVHTLKGIVDVQKETELAFYTIKKLINRGICSVDYESLNGKWYFTDNSIEYIKEYKRRNGENI